MEFSIKEDIARLRISLASLTVSDRRWISTWLLATVGLLFICIVLGIPAVTTFDLYSPAIGLVLPLIFIPVLLLITETQSDSEPLGLGYALLFMVLTIDLIGIVLSIIFTVPITENLLPILTGFAIPFVLLVLVVRVPLKRLGFSGGNVRNIVGTIVLSLALGALVFMLIGFNELMAAIDEIMRIVSGPVLRDIRQLGMLTQAILFGLPALVLISISEEFLYRAVLQTSLTDRLGVMRGILLASLIFGMVHIPANLVVYAYITSSFEVALFQAVTMSFLLQAQGGLLFGVAWERTRSLILPVSLHTTNNVVVMMPVFLFMMLGFL
ncbi:MAG: CPBP family intramembrane glutamic endopeptidase [Candidatus Thorarchaeota archaeon]